MVSRGCHNLSYILRAISMKGLLIAEKAFYIHSRQWEVFRHSKRAQVNTKHQTREAENNLYVLRFRQSGFMPHTKTPKQTVRLICFGLLYPSFLLLL